MEGEWHFPLKKSQIPSQDHTESSVNLQGLAEFIRIPSTDSLIDLTAKSTESLQETPRIHRKNYVGTVLACSWKPRQWLNCSTIPHYAEDRQILRTKLEEALKSEEELRRQVRHWPVVGRQGLHKFSPCRKRCASSIPGN